MALLLLPLLSSMSLGSAPQTLEGLVNIRFVLDVRVFAVMAALNAAGYDRDQEHLQANLARRRVRERLSTLDPDLRERLRAFYRKHDRGTDELAYQGSYASLSLVLNGPPDFELRLRPPDVPDEAVRVAGFEQLVKEVWEKSNLQEVWNELRPAHAEEIESYRPVLRRTIQDTLGYLRTDARLALDRRVVFMPDLLNAYGVVNARNIGDDYYLMVGPTRSGQRPERSLRHEYLHFMMDPLVRKYSGHLPEPEPFLKLVRGQGRVLDRYENDFALVVTESLIKTLERRLDRVTGKENRSQILADFEQGLVLAPYFDEALAAFDAGSMTFQEYCPVLMEGIRWDKEKNRNQWVHAIRSEIGTRKAEEEARARTEIEAGSEVERSMVEANRLLLAKDFERARSVLEQVLEREPENAGALFGLGQIHAQRQAFDQALDFYGRAALHAGAGESWIAAWSFLRSGNIYRFLENREQARKEWARVLGLAGDLRGAREAAQAALSTP